MLGAAATSTSLTSTPNPSTVGQTVTVERDGDLGRRRAHRTVTFRDGATVLAL